MFQVLEAVQVCWRQPAAGPWPGKSVTVPAGSIPAGPFSWAKGHCWLWLCPWTWGGTEGLNHTVSLVLLSPEKSISLQRWEIAVSVREWGE